MTFQHVVENTSQTVLEQSKPLDVGFQDHSKLRVLVLIVCIPESSQGCTFCASNLEGASRN